MTTETPNIAPGWYPAPGEAGLERYWDGLGWTDDRRPQVPVVAPQHRSATGGEIVGFVISIIALLTSFAGGVLIALITLVVLAVTYRRAGKQHSALGRAANIIAIIAAVLGLLFALRAGFAAVGN